MLIATDTHQVSGISGVRHLSFLSARPLVDEGLVDDMLSYDEDCGMWAPEMSV